MQTYVRCLPLILCFFCVTFTSVCTSLSFSIQACHCWSDILLTLRHLLHLYWRGSRFSQLLYSENFRLSFSWWHFCLEVTEKHQMGPGSFQPNLQQRLQEENEILYFHPIYIHIGMELVLSCELGEGSIQGLKSPWLLQCWWWGWLSLDPTHICCSSERLGHCCII